MNIIRKINFNETRFFSEQELKKVQSDASPGTVEVANKVTGRMHDTLNLIQGKRAQVFAINIQLFNQEAEARSINMNRDSLDEETF